MKTIILIAAILSIASAGHPFFAEQNFICRLCKESMNLIKNNDIKKLEMMIQKFPKAQDLFRNHMVYKHLMKQEKQSVEDICAVEYCNDEFEDFEIDHDQIIFDVNRKYRKGEAKWIAGKSDRFKNSLASDVRKTLGTIVDTDWQVKLPIKDDYPDMDLPTNFDSRTQWSNCKEIGRVRDQANCGSCWAFGTTKAFNDRLCIQHGFTDYLSTADTTACCDFTQCFSMGCNGGQIGTPWTWFESTGVVSGGEKEDSPALCYPYTMDECEHHVTGSKPSCPDTQQINPTCNHKCPGNQANYSKDKHKAQGGSYTLNHQNLKKDIYTNGPITGAFTVYEDFLSYKSGVYHHTSGRAIGGHAIKIIGWGVEEEDGTDYLLVANSWNTDWGDKGYFKCTYDTISSFAAGDVSGNKEDFLGWF